MICDLVGSTALSARLDPEDMNAVLDAYHAACARIMLAYDGFIGEFRGDGILAYFGYPRAHEDDAERTVRAGLRGCPVVSALFFSPGRRMNFIEKSAITQRHTGFECTQIIPTSPSDRGVVDPVSSPIGVMIRSLLACAGRLPVSSRSCQRFSSMSWSRGAVDQPTITG